MGFQIFLKLKRLVFIWKRTIPNQFPRCIFGSMYRFLCVVFCNALLEVSSGACVLLIWRINTANNINIPHTHMFPVRRRPFGLCRTLLRLKLSSHGRAMRSQRRSVVLAAGIEPARPKGQQILSLQRLPIPPRELLWTVLFWHQLRRLSPAKPRSCAFGSCQATQNVYESIK